MTPPAPSPPAAAKAGFWENLFGRVPADRDTLRRPYKRLAMELYFEFGGTDRGLCLMLSSPTSTAATTQITIELAAFLADEQGHQVLIVDAAGSLPELADHFSGDPEGMPAGPSLTDRQTSAMLPTGNPRIRLLAAAGLEKQGHRGLPSAGHLRSQLDGLARDHDFVLINSASFLADPALLAFPAAVDCVLLLGIAGATTRRELAACRRALTSCKARKLGLIFVQPREGK